MFVYNIKINGSKVFKTFFIFIFILIIIIFGISCFKIFGNASSNFKVADSDNSKNNVFTLNPKNYANILKTVHENIDTYVGMKINFTGYVYRVLDLEDNQFVLARNMVINSNYQSVVIGFLCEYDNAKDFADNTWVEITGEIKKGNYHGDMPIIHITEMKTVDKPNDEFVYPPDESYIPTSSSL